jgi:hypothetical protein
MYKVLKDIYILGVFPESLGDSCTPNAPTVDPPLASRGCQSPATRADPEGGLSGLRRPCSQTTELNTRMTKQVATNATPIDTVVCWCATSWAALAEMEMEAFLVTREHGERRFHGGIKRGRGNCNHAELCPTDACDKTLTTDVMQQRQRYTVSWTEAIKWRSKTVRVMHVNSHVATSEIWNRGSDSYIFDDAHARTSVYPVGYLN